MISYVTIVYGVGQKTPHTLLAPRSSQTYSTFCKRIIIPPLHWNTLPAGVVKADESNISFNGNTEMSNNYAIDYWAGTLIHS